jgi:hypothetical protein
MWSNNKIIDVGDFKRRRETAVATHPPSFDPTRTKLRNERTANDFVGFDQMRTEFSIDGLEAGVNVGFDNDFIYGPDDVGFK